MNRRVGVGVEQLDSASHVFVCYSHEDSATVLKEIDALEEGGCRVWYDDGISAGVRWSDELAQHILDARLVLFFASPRSTVSENCLDEINFALDNGKPVVVVYLEKTELSAGAALRLAHRQAIHRYELSDGVYKKKLRAAVGVAVGNAASPAPTGRRRTSLVAVGGLLLALMGYVVWESDLGRESDSKTTGGPSIAVLPFVNMSADPDQDFFADGISEEVLNHLAKIPELRVISRTSAFSLKGRNLDIATVAETLNVGHVLEGSVRKAGNRVRVTAQLIETIADSRLWSESYDRDLDDIFAIQDEIAQQVAARLRVTLLGTQDMPTTSALAYTNYLQARSLLHQFDARNYDLVRKLLDQALEDDPKFSLAWVELSRLHLRRWQVGAISEDEFRIERESAIRNALAADPTRPEVLVAQGGHLLQANKDRAGAAKSFLKALQLAPTNVEALTIATLMALNLGRVEQSIEIGEQVVLRDPLCAPCHGNLASAYFYAGEFDKALEHADMFTILAPAAPQAGFMAARVALHKGDAAAALEMFQELPKSAFRALGLFWALHELGRDGESQSHLQELRQQWGETQPLVLANAYAWMGEADEAFKWLDKSAPIDPLIFDFQRYLSPVLLRLSDDSRWQEYLIRTNAAPEALEAIDFDFVLLRDV